MELRFKGELSQTELADQLGITQQRVNYNVQQLRRLHILRKWKKGLRSYCDLNEDYLKEVSPTIDPQTIFAIASVCPKCGSKVRVKAKFCDQCGEKIFEKSIREMR